MIENTDSEQVERLNSRVIELLRERDALVRALEKIAAMDPKGIRADDLGRAARIAAEGIRSVVGNSLPSTSQVSLQDGKTP